MSSPNASLNESVAIECSAEPSRPPGRQLRLLGSRLPLQPWAEDPRPMELVAGEDDDGTEFICEAKLRLDNQTLRRSWATATLRVMCEWGWGGWGGQCRCQSPGCWCKALLSLCQTPWSRDKGPWPPCKAP